VRAIWGICVGAALVVAGLVAWTYTIEPEDVGVAGQLFLLTDAGMGMALFVAVVHLATEYLVSYAQARRLIGAVAVLLLGVASVACGAMFIRPGAGTSRTTGRP
jgi:hypothetical protein